MADTGNVGGFVSFEKATDWRALVRTRILEIKRAKFARAQPLYLLGWVDFSVIRAGELSALIALELAVMELYGCRISKKKRNLAAMRRHMAEVDGLTDAQIPIVVRWGGSAVGQLIGDVHQTLTERRNALAHGDAFYGMPTGGFELVRDLLNYAYRDYIAEARVVGDAAPFTPPSR
jgi:hypothetical protein